MQKNNCIYLTCKITNVTNGSAMLALFCILFTNFVIGQCRLQITKLEVESPMVVGEGGWLKCEWDGGGKRIYSAKWYLDRHEFYRWTPSDRNRVKVFPRPEFLVDVRKSRQGHVFIQNVTLEAAGMLRCEVSEEGPVFHTEYNTTELSVIDLPDERPVITGVLPLYQMHRDVNLNCKSPNSNPAAQLTFFVNREPADSSWLIPQHTKVNSQTSLETSSLGLRFPLRPLIVRQGRVVVKCVAKIQLVYWASSEVILSVDLPQRASRMEERALGNSTQGTLMNILLMVLSLLYTCWNT